MGSFAYTCAVSSLPIEAGDEVRYLLLTKNPYHDGAGNTCYIHDLWFPRTFPLSGNYNDYGSVENITNGPERDIWLDGLKLDLVERGWGENTVHDVPTKKEMSFDELLSAIQEGRVSVDREYNRRHVDVMGRADDLLRGLKPKLEEDLSPEEKRDRSVPIGVPTMFRIQKAAEKIGIPIYDGNWNKKSIVIDSPFSGEVRIRCHIMYGQDHAKPDEKFIPGASVLEQVDVLSKLQAELSDYATIISSSSNACGVTDSNKVSYSQPDTEMLIRPKPGTRNGTLARHREVIQDKPLAVGHAMIREDIWQAMLKGTVETWDGKHFTRVGIDKFYDGIAKYVEYLSKESEDPLVKKYGRLGSRLDHAENLPGAWIASKDVIPFTIGLASHFELMMTKPEQPAEFFKTVAEFAFINCLLSQTRYQWRLSSSAGPQFGEWEAHEKLLKSFAKVASTVAKEQKAERAKW